MTHADVVIIGSGAAGETVAALCAKAGRTVAVIDRRPFGGTCNLRGCVPKKVLYSAAEAVAHARMLDGKGLTSRCEIDWPSLMAYKRTYTDGVPQRTETWMHEAGIETIQGTARFVSRDEISVDGRLLSATAFVVATGARPMPLGIPGEELVSTSEDFLDLDSLPRRIAFIGGGYISFEFAGIARRAGAEVTIMHGQGDLLAGFDRGLARAVADRYRSLGVEILTGASVDSVSRTGGGLLVTTATARVEADFVVHGAGRIPDLEALDLDSAGVEHTRHGVLVGSDLRSTTNEKVWAIGDASAIGAPLTPVAGAQGEVAAANILGGTAAYDPSVTPSVIFSDPPLARVGMSAEAASADDRYEVRTFEMGTWLSQSRLGNDTAGATLVIDTQTDRIAGAHLLGIGADEAINIFTVAMRFGITVDQLKTVTWAYPTLGYEINYLTGRY